MKQESKDELVKFLNEKGIDAHRIGEDEWDDKGYFYRQLHKDGRPKYDWTNRIVREFVEWPDEETHLEVVRLYNDEPHPRKRVAHETVAKDAAPEVENVAEQVYESDESVTKTAPVKKGAKK